MPLCRYDVFRLSLGTGLAIGLISECFFASLVTGIPSLALEIPLILAAAFFVARNRRPCRFCQMPSDAGERTLTRTLTAVLGLLLALDLCVFAWTSARVPQGGWDAWAIWNLRAHFLYRAGGAAWRDAFTEVLAWSHPDYPLLLPAFIARGWTLLGKESNAIPIGLAGFFAFGCVGLISGSIGILRGAGLGLLSGIVLAATPSLFVQGAMQYADVPLAFFRLASLAAFALADRFNKPGFAAAAGVAAALGAWTKNEGVLWLGAFLAALALYARRRLLCAFLEGALPALAPVLYFKLRIATSSDIFGAAGRAGMWGRAMDPGRYALIVKESWLHIWSFGPLPAGIFVWLGVFFALSGMRREDHDSVATRTGAIALLSTTAGYFAIYILRSLDLKWLLDTSADRLLLQLWPTIVFVVFLACRSPVRITETKLSLLTEEV